MQPAARARTSGVAAASRHRDASRAGGATGRDRDPTSATRRRLGAATRDLARTRGWSPRVAEGTVFGQWQTVVGEQIAEHATPTALREGVLSVSAESTAWATQLRMVQSQLLAKIAAAVGDGVVTSLKIVGPSHAIVAQRPLPHRRPRAARHLWIRPSCRLAESRQNAETRVLKRLDAPRIEKFHRRRK